MKDKKPRRSSRQPDSLSTPVNPDNIDPTKVTQIRGLLDGPSKGWFYTVGMEKFNLPNLEVRDIPLFVGQAAMRLLMEVAHYMLNQKPINEGETMSLGDLSLMFEKGEPRIPEEEMHYQHGMLRIVDGKGYKCTCCESGNCPH